MQQLTGLDASFLYLETANTPMHISGLGIYDPSTAVGGKVRFKQIVENVRQRAQRIPAMCSTLQTVPLRWDHPYWKRGGHFDPEFHIRHVAVPQPGDWRQLCILIARLHARPLDRRRPLWEMYVIEGLDKVEGYPKGCFALFTKVHHAAVDGASGNEISAILHDLSPDWELPAMAEEPAVDRTPGGIELLLRAQLNTLKQPFRFLDVARHAIPGVARFAAGISSGRLQRVSNLPRTRFNHTVSPHRVFGAEVFDFADIRAIKNAVAPATVNDVALAICGGALHHYLKSKGELPDKSLAAMAPINIRTEDKKGAFGNLVSQMTVNVRSDIENPLQRLQAVTQGTRGAKELTDAIGAKTMTDYTRFVPSTLTASAARLASSLGLANHIKPIYNCVITNVPGPQKPLYFTGAKMLSNMGTGPIMDGTGLFHAIASYCGQFAISFVSCRVMMPDPGFYSQCLRESFAELKAATAVMGGVVAAKPKRKKGPSKARQKKLPAKVSAEEKSPTKSTRARAARP
jgi:WS/DGAT/MGAT family acyltransferase